MKTRTIPIEALSLHHAAATNDRNLRLQVVRVGEQSAEAADSAILAHIDLPGGGDPMSIPVTLARTAATQLKKHPEVLVRSTSDPDQVALTAGGASLRQDALYPDFPDYPNTAEIYQPVLVREHRLEVSLDVGQLVRLVKALGGKVTGKETARVTLCYGDPAEEPVLVRPSSSGFPDSVVWPQAWGLIMPCK